MLPDLLIVLSAYLCLLDLSYSSFFPLKHIYLQLFYSTSSFGLLESLDHFQINVQRIYLLPTTTCSAWGGREDDSAGNLAPRSQLLPAHHPVLSAYLCLLDFSETHIYSYFYSIFFFFKFLNMYYYSVVNTKSSENQVLDFWIAGKSCWCWGKKSKPETCSETCLETCQVTCWRMHAPCPCPLSSCTT